MATIGPATTGLTQPPTLPPAPPVPGAPGTSNPTSPPGGGSQAAAGLEALTPILTQLAAVIQGLVGVLQGSSGAQSLGGGPTAPGAPAPSSGGCPPGCQCCGCSSPAQVGGGGGGAVAGADGPGAPTGGGSAGATLRGTFQNVGKSVSGEASVSTDASGQQVLNLRNFRSDAGPDVHVYLTPKIPTDGSEPAEFIDLGPLSSFSGDQSLPIPPGTDLSKYNTVTIWCDEANTTFGAATLA